MAHPFPIKPVVLVVCVLSAPAVAWSQSEPRCGPLKYAYGPYDYRTERNGALVVVEKSHFDAGVETLTRGIGSDYLQGDLDYVLRASPNHHRALMATIRLGERMGTTHIPKMTYSIECYLERAVRFQPNDTVARALYANYLGKTLKQPAEGIALLDAGLKYTSENPLSVYNFGLVYFELGDYDRALRQAQEALALGFPRMELKTRLEQAGRWRDPPAANPAASAASAPAPTDAASASAREGS